MSELEISNFPGVLTLTPIRWQCHKHGATHEVLTIYTPHHQRTICVLCFLDLLERLGLDDLPRVE